MVFSRRLCLESDHAAFSRRADVRNMQIWNFRLQIFSWIRFLVTPELFTGVSLLLLLLTINYCRCRWHRRITHCPGFATIHKPAINLSPVTSKPPLHSNIFTNFLENWKWLLYRVDRVFTDSGPWRKVIWKKTKAENLVLDAENSCVNRLYDLNKKNPAKY